MTPEAPQFIPRIQARVGEAVDSATNKHIGFVFEIFITEMGGGKPEKPLHTAGPYKTEKEAHEKMHEAVKMVLGKFEEMTGHASGYFDLKNNEYIPDKSGFNG